MKRYIVKQGDYLQKVAHALGFDPDKVWTDPQNADLKALRDPDILCPGDILFVPDTDPPPTNQVSQGASNDYTADIPVATFNLVFKGEDQPLANEPYFVEGLGTPQEGSTDGDGKVTLKVPVHLRECRIVFPDKGIGYPVRVGDMDPIEEAAGVRKRLQHLGFRGQDDEDSGDMSEDGMLARDGFALLLFQAFQGLPTSGTLDDATKAALLKAHGS